MTGGHGDSLTKKAISIRGKVKNIGQDLLDTVFEENPYMKEIYPETSRHALEVFQLYEGQGEYFDLSAKPIFRDSFTLGTAELKQTQYHISEKCISCDSCIKVCPQNCISKGAPYSIAQENCLNCGLCFENCPVKAIKHTLTR
jgi:NAD-dependent dihydropyrimidine dehydrogenase PreA subunit